MPRNGQPHPKQTPPPNKSAAARSLIPHPAGLCDVVPKLGQKFDRSYLVNFQAGAELNNSHFIDTGCIGLEIDRVSFRYSVFERAYFRNVKFIKCQFTGSRFNECSFPGCVFESCDFSFVSFQDTSVSWEQIQHTLPSYPNLRRDLLQNLRSNAVSIGDYYGQRHFIDMEIKAQREYFRRAIARDEQYFKDKYDTIGKRINLRLRSVRHRIAYALCGNGEHISRLFVSSGVFLVFIPIIHLIGISTDQTTLRDLTVLYFSALQETFLLFVDAPDRGKEFGALYITAVLLARYAVLGLAVSALFRRLSLR